MQQFGGIERGLKPATTYATLCASPFGKGGEFPRPQAFGNKPNEDGEGKLESDGYSIQILKSDHDP